MAELRPYKIGDEEGIVKLFNEVFNKNRNVEYWKWEFLKNPYGQGVMALEDENGRIVGQCTLLPSKMQLGGREVLGGQSIDAMVHKDFRRRGYYEHMAFYSYELGIKRDIKFRYGFPSKPALQGILEKLGGSLVCDIPLYMDVYRIDNLMEDLIKNKILSKILAVPAMLMVKIYRGKVIKSKNTYEIEEITSFDNRFDEFWKEVKDKYPTMTARESVFLNWRVKDHPTIPYKTFAAVKDGNIKGYIIFKVEEKLVRGKYPLKFGSIVDLVGENEDVIVCLYEKAKEYLKTDGVNFTVCWILNGMIYGETIKKLGFIKTKSTIPFAVKNLTENHEIDSYIFEEKNWYLMPIESDIY